MQHSPAALYSQEQDLVFVKFASSGDRRHTHGALAVTQLTQQEQYTMAVLRRIRQYAREHQQEHNSSCDKSLAEAVRLLELETIG